MTFRLYANDVCMVQMWTWNQAQGTAVQEGAHTRDVRVNVDSEDSLRREGYCSGVRRLAPVSALEW